LDNAQARYTDLRGADLRRARLFGLRSVIFPISSMPIWRESEMQGADFLWRPSFPGHFAQALAAAI